ncbi:23S rRNA (adenine(2503)-C2)-methyltransferase [bacterium SM23_57]|jgi:23S rRNA (adenine2503-C2)-methyltransferase|nr:MAG: 23S rRNA (adenine(2503)-C2)-methyltransferase [bacterium SM23_57]
MQKRLIYDLDLPDLTEILTSWHEPAYRAIQIWKGIYQQYWQEPDDFSNLPKQLRKRLFEHFVFNHLTPSVIQKSSDGETEKTLFHLPDGKRIETVLMHYDVRRTLCISTQSGCAMGCVFCATGQMGYFRNLSSGEIVEQIIHYARYLKTRGDRVTNVVFMGMGEPFHNYSNVMAAIDTLNHAEGMNLGGRRFTISTVGLVPGISRFTKEDRQVNLAVSLHAANNELRSSMIPINRKYPIEALIPVLREYTTVTKRRVTFEWALIQDVNDTLEQAKKLSELIQGMLAHVNLIPLNPTQGYMGQATNPDRANQFRSLLESRGISCTIRVRRGIDIQAGCGQLANDDT